MNGTLKVIDIRGEKTIEEIREIIYDFSLKWIVEPEEKLHEDFKSKLEGIKDWKFLDDVLNSLQKQLIYNLPQLLESLNAYIL